MYGVTFLSHTAGCSLSCTDALWCAEGQGPVDGIVFVAEFLKSHMRSLYIRTGGA